MTQRVRLRAIEPEDLDLIWEWRNDAALLREMGSRGRITSRVTEEAWLEAEETKGSPADGRTLVIEDAEGRPLGLAWHGAFDAVDRVVTVGLFLAREADRGQGTGTEALRLLLSHLFGDLGVHKARLLVRADHAAAIRSYRKVGFQDEGVLREQAFFDGRWHDFLGMGLLASEFVRP